MNFKEKTTYFELSNDEFKMLFKKHPSAYSAFFLYFNFCFQSFEKDYFGFNLSNGITQHLKVYFDFKCLNLELLSVEALTEKIEEKINQFKYNNYNNYMTLSEMSNKVCFSNHYHVCIKNKKTNKTIGQKIILDHNKIMKREKQDLDKAFLDYLNAIHKEIIKITSKIE